MTAHVTSLFMKSIIFNTISRPILICRNFTGSIPARARKSDIDYDEKPDNVFSNMSRDKNSPSSDLTQERVDELSKLSHNAFKLFKLGEKFDLNTGSLQREMRNLQQLLHPDKIHDAGKPIRDKADDLSALVNDYYAILKHPYKRAKYLLSVKLGKSQDEIEKDLDKLKIDDDFLARMMDMRETLEDPTTEQYNLVKIENELSSDLNTLLRELNHEFESKNMDRILPKLGRLKFLANCHHIVTDRLGSFSEF